MLMYAEKYDLCTGLYLSGLLVLLSDLLSIHQTLKVWIVIECQVIFS
jgi:hypothetical protein